MKRWRVVPLYAEPFMVNALHEEGARRKGHIRLLEDHPTWRGSVIWRCDEADEAESASLADA